MRRILLVALIWLASWPALAQAQLLLTGAGGGSPAVAGYVGPGDIQTFAHYWGLRCYNTAYAGDVADVWDTATGTTTETLLTCSAGGTVNQTIHTLAVTCAVSCSVLTLYDQPSSVNMSYESGVGTLSTAPTLIASCTNSKPCMVFNGNYFIGTDTTAEETAITLGFTASVFAVGKRTGAFSSYNSLGAGRDGSTYQIGWTNSANQYFSYDAASVLNVTAADSTFHVTVAVFTGSASDSLTIDGGTPATGATGTSTLSATAYILGSNGGSNLTGDVTEIGLIATTASASLCHNARVYWGSAGSC